LIVAGNPKNCEEYWNAVQKSLDRLENHDRILQHIAFIPDAETEIYFKAADVVVLPYRHIFQSGVLSLSYSFGVPVIASDVGALREDIIEGKTGFVCRPEDPAGLARAIEKYFATDLYFRLSSHRQEIREYACGRYSWDVVSELTKNVYEDLLGKHRAGKSCQFAQR
jgi:D-inositol-3-phosphate glycosyltransferase